MVTIINRFLNLSLLVLDSIDLASQITQDVPDDLTRNQQIAQKIRVAAQTVFTGIRAISMGYCEDFDSSISLETKQSIKMLEGIAHIIPASQHIYDLNESRRNGNEVQKKRALASLFSDILGGLRCIGSALTIEPLIARISELQEELQKEREALYPSQREENQKVERQLREEIYYLQRDLAEKELLTGASRAIELGSRLPQTNDNLDEFCRFCDERRRERAGERQRENPIRRRNAMIFFPPSDDRDPSVERHEERQAHAPGHTTPAQREAALEAIRRLLDTAGIPIENIEDRIPEELHGNSFFSAQEGPISREPIRYPLRDPTTALPLHDPETGLLLRDSTTGLPLRDPNTGTIYEASEIIRWVIRDGRSPFTRDPLRIEDLQPVPELQAEINEMLGLYGML